MKLSDETSVTLSTNMLLSRFWFQRFSSFTVTVVGQYKRSAIEALRCTCTTVHSTAGEDTEVIQFINCVPPDFDKYDSDGINLPAHIARPFPL